MAKFRADLPKSLTLSAPVEFAQLEAVNGAKAEPAFSMVAYSGGPARAGWGRPVVVDIAGLEIGQSTTILLNHDSSAIVGQSREVKVQQGQILVRGIFTGDVEDKADPAGFVVAHARRKFKWAASIGFAIDRVERVDAEQVVTVNGRKFNGPLYVVRAGRLGEVSFVGTGADPNASASVAAAYGGKSMTFEEFVVSLGLDPATLTAEQRKALQAHFDGLPKRGEPAESNDEDAAAGGTESNSGLSAELGQAAVTAARQQVVAENERISKLQKLFGGKHPEVLNKAIADGLSFEQAEGQFYKAENAAILAARPTGIAIHSGARPTATSETLEAALCLHGKLPNIEKSFAPQTLETAQKLHGRTVGLQELIMGMALQNGYRGNALSLRGNLREVLKFAFSTNDISGILSNTANKFLLAGFMMVERIWALIAARRSVSDFKRITSYRLTGGMEYEKVAPDGKLKHKSLGEETYGNQIDTYGVIHAIDRRDIINDDLGALTAVPQRIGRGAGLKINDIFWTVFLNNGSVFTTGNKNYKAGADTALSLSALEVAEQMCREMKDADGTPLGFPTYPNLLVPPAINRRAIEINRSPEYRDTTASTKTTTTNTFAGMFNPLSSSYMGSTKYTGNSQKKWYLLLPPEVLPLIEIAFLDGKEEPTVETSEADFDTLGIDMRGFHDFGVEFQDFRAGVAMKGEV